MAQSAESLVEERVTQLQEISKRRNELLREMYHLIQRRDNLGSVISIDDDVEDGLQTFLQRFDLEKYPETGNIDTLLEDEVALPETPPAYSPVIGPLPVLELEPEPTPEAPTPEAEPEPVPPERDLSEESSMSDPPASPLIVKREGEEGLQYSEDPEAAVHMDVDESAPAPPTERTEALGEEQEMAEEVMSSEPSQEPQTAPQSPIPAEGEPPLTEDSVPGKSPSPKQERLPTPTPPPSTLPVRESPVSQSSTVSAEATQEPTAPRLSLPPPEGPVQSPATQDVADDESAIKTEPADHKVMEDIDMQVEEEAHVSPVAQEAASHPPAVAALIPITKERSEDQIMDILGPSQPRSSPAPVDEDQERSPSVDYSIPLPTISPSVTFAFDSGADIAMEVEEPAEPPPAPFGPDPPYPLPPASLLPVEFSRRKAKRKRDKDKGEVKEWQPMPLNKWSAHLKANPVHTKLPRASKCLNTRDWQVGLVELRLLRVFERIEKLKESNAWSFRQPRKQRGVGGLTKTHWDYLMDEMKWMRTDFREERRWKLALAYNLAHAVVEWHEAGTLEERVRRGIVVLWKPPSPEETEMAEANEADGPFRDTQDTDENGVDSRETGTPLDGYVSDEESDDEQDKDQQDALDTLEPGAALQEALEQLEEEAKASTGQPDSQDIIVLKPKMEEIDDLTALGDNGSSQDSDAMDVDGKKADVPEAQKASADLKPSVPETHPGLKSSSKNPVLAPTGKDGEGSHGKNKQKGNQYAALRDHIVYSDVNKLFIDLDDFDLVKTMSELSTEDPLAAAATPLPPPHDLADIFPDLQPYGMNDVAPYQEIRKKSERKSDRDDPNKRAEDATYTKLAPMSKFMFVKPVLVGTLKPASHFQDGQWTPIEETPVFADVDIPTAKQVEGDLCSLFEGTASKPNGPANHPPLMPAPPRDVRKRNAEHHNDAVVWTPVEDALLKQAVERYPYNWSLIAEAFNSSRVTISTDRRTGWECLERWREKFSAQARVDASEDNSPAAASTSASASHMTTRGLKRSANQALSASSGSSNANSNEPRKRRRHTAMYEQLRKAAKKREAVQRNAGPRAKPSIVHDTHGQFTKMPRLTPSELSRMKADKEARDASELLARRRNDELARQHLLREQQQRAQGLPANAPQGQPQQQQLLPQTPTANVSRPANVPQVQSIRSSQVGISQQQQQQQRLAAAYANASARMSPPQLAQLRAMQALGQFQQQAQSQAQVQAPAQAQAAAQGQVPGQAQVPVPQQSSAAAALAAAAPALSAAHLSPSFAARATSSSPSVPQQSPPLPAASPVNAAAAVAAAAARPPSVPGQQGMPVNPLQMPNMQYYMHRPQFSQDQIQALLAQQLRHHQQQQQQAQQGQQQQYAAHTQQSQAQNPPNGSFPHS
ncbi:hypothetical protein C8Q80DRAFT_731689 [Daedaleopsis nitida]|nr:hypothetical protein C8Q80DRAFT_731689 [Daedaleopsis nitida]